MDKEVQGKINERLQVILSTAQNCIHEIREDADAIELGWILIDLRRVVKNVECISEIMRAAGKDGVGEMKYKVDYRIADSDEAQETVARLNMLSMGDLAEVLAMLEGRSEDELREAILKHDFETIEECLPSIYSKWVD